MLLWYRSDDSKSFVTQQQSLERAQKLQIRMKYVNELGLVSQRNRFLFYEITLKRYCPKTGKLTKTNGVKSESYYHLRMCYLQQLMHFFQKWESILGKVLTRVHPLNSSNPFDLQTNFSLRSSSLHPGPKMRVLSHLVLLCGIFETIRSLSVPCTRLWSWMNYASEASQNRCTQSYCV